MEMNSPRDWALQQVRVEPVCDVVIYNGNEQPEKQGIITHVCIHGIPSIHIYKKESLRNWVV